MTKNISLAVAATLALLIAGVSGAESPKTFTGVVTDTMCGSNPHRNMMKDKTDAECTRLCARGPNGFALYDGETVMKLSDQKTPAKYAGERVRVTGTYDEKTRTLKVVSMELAGGN